MNDGYIKPTCWDMYLQFITFACNIAKHASTGFSPFHLMFGRQPVLPNEEGLIIPELKNYETVNWVNYLYRYIPLLHGKALKNIKASQGYQKTFYDKGRRVKYDHKVGVLVLRKNLEKTPFPKELWSGPYNIISKNNEEGTSWKIIKQGDSRFYITTANVRHMRPYYQDQNSSNSGTSIYQQKMSKIKSGMCMHTLSKMEDAMKRSVANISDDDESSASLPPRRR
ncbi:hypothetical protein G6F43_007436 [Rhizopus delemar]|nr:hypothetical protein G6F43_007436 [Rhizopus delemar]